MLPQLAISLDVKAEIQNAIAAGKEASVSQANVTVNGWTGVGYIIEDPATGAAAYKISGGANGGYLLAQGGMALFGLIQLVNGLALLGPILGLTLVGAPVGAAVILLVAVITVIGALLSNNPYAASAVSVQLQAIVALTTIGAIAFIGWPILFAFLYVALLLFVVDIIMSATFENRYEPLIGRRALA